MEVESDFKPSNATMGNSVSNSPECITEKAMLDLVDGVIPENEIESVLLHISECQECESRLLEIESRTNKQINLPSVMIHALQDSVVRGIGSSTFDVLTRQGKSLIGNDRGITRTDTSEIPKQIGKFKVLEKIARGGFGVVYKCWDESLSRHVAVKQPRDDIEWSSGDIHRFLNEAQTTASLEHTNIIPVYQCEHVGDGAFFSMKWVEGKTFREWSKNRSIEERCRVLVKVAEALHFSHQKGFVHRDLKPANILMDGDRPFVSDFGLALHESALANRRGEVSGTISYMSPEQVEGKVDLIDARSDVWSLGVMLYEALTNRRPFSNRSGEIKVQIREKVPNAIALYNENVSKELIDLCTESLAKTCDQRVQTAKEFASRLSSATESVAIPKTQPSFVPGNVRTGTYIALCSILFLAVAFAFYSTVVDSDSMRKDNANVWRVTPISFPVSETSSWEIENNKLSVITNRTSLLELKRETPPDFDFSIDCFLPNWNGNFAIVFGNDGQSFQTIEFGKFTNNRRQLIYSHHDCRVNPADGPTNGINNELVEIPPRELGQFKSIEISVRNRRLVGVNFDGKELSQLVEVDAELIPPEINLEVHGSLGIQVDRCAVSFQNITFNNQPVLLEK